MMSIAWMLSLTLVVFAEKVFPHGVRTSPAAVGLGLCLARLAGGKRRPAILVDCLNFAVASPRLWGRGAACAGKDWAGCGKTPATPAAAWPAYKDEQNLPKSAATLRLIIRGKRRINPIFIVLFKLILDPAGLVLATKTGKQGPFDDNKIELGKASI